MLCKLPKKLKLLLFLERNKSYLYPIMELKFNIRCCNSRWSEERYRTLNFPIPKCNWKVVKSGNSNSTSLPEYIHIYSLISSSWMNHTKNYRVIWADFFLLGCMRLFLRSWNGVIIIIHKVSPAASQLICLPPLFVHYCKIKG